MKKYWKSAVIFLIVILTTFGMVACKKPDMVDLKKLDPSLEAGNYKIEGEIEFTYSPAATSEDYKQAADRFVNAFQKKYKDVKVKTDYTPTSDNRIATAEIGDVFYFAEVDTYKYAVKNKALLQLDSFVAAYKIDTKDVYAGILQLGLVNGRLFFVPRDYNQIALIYNKSAIAEKGLTERVTPEWTWEDFQAICAELTDGETYYGAKLNLAYSPVYVPFFESISGDSWCNTVDKKITFIDNDNTILKTFGEALTLAKAQQIAINTINESDVKGEAVFKTLVYPAVQTEGKTYDGLAVDWDLINMPLFEHPKFGCGASGVGVFSRTSNPTAAAAFALFFLDTEGQKAFNAGTGGSVPLLSSLDKSGYDAWKYPEDENWSSKNWDAFVYLAETASVGGQVNCRMPIEIAELIDKEITTIIKKDLTGVQEYTDGFAALQQKCNEKWATLQDW